MPWEIGHIIGCEAMHALLGLLVGGFVFLITLIAAYRAGIKRSLHMGNLAVFVFCMVPAACVTVIVHVLEDYWVGLF